VRRLGNLPESTIVPITEAELRDLRLRYESAYTAYQSCVTALKEAGLKRERPSQQLLERETKALGDLNYARECYRDALM
jgi:hypothetical protein